MTVRGLQAQPQQSLGRTIGQSVGQADRVFEMRDRLVVGGSVQRPVTGLDPPFDGSFAEPRLREMMGDDFRLSLGRYLEPVAQRLGNPQMQQLPTALKYVLISRLLYQRVLEAVDGFRWIAAAKHQFRVLELDERILQCP